MPHLFFNLQMARKVFLRNIRSRYTYPYTVTCLYNYRDYMEVDRKRTISLKFILFEVYLLSHFKNYYEYLHFEVFGLTSAFQKVFSKIYAIRFETMRFPLQELSVGSSDRKLFEFLVRCDQRVAPYLCTYLRRCFHNVPLLS